MDKNIIVLYHGNCTDGFCSAWAAWKKFGDSADYFGVKLGFPPPDNLTEKEIYTLDFTYPTKYSEELLKNNKKLISIDHHLTSQDFIKISSDYRFDLNHSGAILSWNYFHPDKNPPRILTHVEDWDLWRFSLPYTKEVFAYLELFDFDFKLWDQLINDLENEDKFKAVIPQAELLFKYEEALVKGIVNQKSELVEFEGVKTYTVNSPIFEDHIAQMLYKKLPPMAVVWYRDANRIKFSLRSDKEKDFDVSKLAQKYGGGGHRTSSGFSLPIDSKLPWKTL